MRAAAGEMTFFAYEPRRSVDEGSGWFTNVLMMVVLILALVGLDTLRSAAKNLLTVEVGDSQRGCPDRVDESSDGDGA